ncbi:Imm1 family immunity protein [Streptomyces sp. NPDC004376]
MPGRVQAYYRTEHGDDPMLLQDGSDVDSFVDALLASEVPCSMAALYSLERPPLPTGFPDHELLVGVNRDLQVGVLGFMDDGNFVSHDSSDSSANQREVSYSIMGSVTEFPKCSEVGLPLVRQAVKEFLSSGGKRPVCVQWQEPEFW